MWNLEKLYRCTYLQSRHRDTDLKIQKYGYQGGWWGGMNWEIGVDMYTLLCIKQITNENLQYILQNLLCALWWLNGKEIQKEGIYVFV